MSKNNRLKKIGLGTALILCIAALMGGYYLISGPLIDSVGIQGRGWADTLASVILAGIALIAIYSVASILLLIGSIGSIIIVISFVAAKINQSISPEEHKLVKWALGMLTVKKLLKASILILSILAGSSYIFYEVDDHLMDSFRSATYDGNLERTKNLLRWRAISDFEVVGLKFAAEKGHIDIVEFLIEEGFSIQPRDLQKAAEKGHMNIVKLLLANGVEVQEVDLNWVARGGHIEVVALLLQKGAQLKGTGALSFAAQYGHTDLVALLIDVGVELNQCTSNDAYAPPRVRCAPVGLKSAIYGEHIEIVRMLIEAGANVLAMERTRPSRNFIQFAKSQGNKEVIQLLESAVELPIASNVINAAQHGDWERLQRVIALGAPVNQIETSYDATYGWTALMYAADQGLAKIVKILLAAGADVSYASPANETAMSLATKNRHQVVVKILSEVGAE